MKLGDQQTYFTERWVRRAFEPRNRSGGRSSPSQTTSSRHSFRSEEPGHGADTTHAAALCFSGSRPHWKQSVENVFAEKAYKSYEFATDTFCYELSEIRDVLPIATILRDTPGTALSAIRIWSSRSSMDFWMVLN